MAIRTTERILCCAESEPEASKAELGVSSKSLVAPCHPGAALGDLVLSQPRGATRLEDELGAELHLTRRTGAEDPPEVRREGDTVRHVEVRAIEQIEDLPPELEPDAVSEIDGLLEHGVNLGVPRRQNGVTRGVAERVRRRDRETCRVEPLS